MATTHKQHHDDLADAVNKIEAELGTLPKGAAADVKTRITNTEAVANGAVAKSLVDAKGDLYVGTANDTVARLAVGSNNQVLTADSAQTGGVKWAAAGAVSDGIAVYNVKRDYSAVGDGATDDTTAIQNAINAASAAGGGIVYLPLGTYLLVTGLTMKTGVHLLGARGLSILKANTAISMVSSSTTSQTKWSVRDVTFDLNNITSGTNYGIIIQHNTCDYVTIEGCEFKNYGTGTNTRAGIRLVGSYKATKILNNRFLGSAATTQDNGYGVFCEAAAEGLEIRGNRAEGCFNTFAIWNSGANAASNFVISSNIIGSYGKYGIYMLGVSHGTVVNNVVAGTTYVQSGADASAGITCGYNTPSGCANVTITGNTLSNGGEISAYDSANITISSNNIKTGNIEIGGNITGNTDINVIGNTITSNPLGSCMFIGPVTRCNVIGNRVSGAVGGSSDGITISPGATAFGVSRVNCVGNHSYSNGGDGISVLANGATSGASDIAIAHNTCNNNGVRGIELLSNALITRIRIEFNECLSNTSAAITIGGLAQNVRRFGNITANGDYNANTFALFNV